MDDAFLMRRIERVNDLSGDCQRLGEEQRSRRDLMGERRAFDEFEDERLDAIDFFHAMDGGDVRMVQRREQLRLMLETRETLVVTSNRGRAEP
jgi:hypothetical protein